MQCFKASATNLASCGIFSDYNSKVFIKIFCDLLSHTQKMKSNQVSARSIFETKSCIPCIILGPFLNTLSHLKCFFSRPKGQISVQSQQQQNWNNIQGVGVVLLLLTFKHVYLTGVSRETFFRSYRCGIESRCKSRKLSFVETRAKFINSLNAVVHSEIY